MKEKVITDRQNRETGTKENLDRQTDRETERQKRKKMSFVDTINHENLNRERQRNRETQTEENEC